MAVIENRFVCDLSKPVQAQALKGNVFSLDNLGSRISVLIYENGQPATISGSITANCILPDGSTVNVNGSLTTENGGSKVYVDVPQSCLLIPGILKIAIKCTSSSVITTLAAIVANVYMTKTDNVITPSQQIINDWNAEISAAITTQNAAIANQDTKINDLKSAFIESVGDFQYVENTSGTGNLYCDRAISLTGGEVIQIKICNWSLPLANRTSITIYARGSSNVSLGTIATDIAIPSDVFEFTVPTGTFTSIRVAFKANTAAGSASVLIGIKRNTYITTIEKRIDDINGQIDGLGFAFNVTGTSTTKNIYCDKNFSFSGGGKIAVRILKWSSLLRHSIRLYVFNGEESTNLGMFPIPYSEDAYYTFDVPAGEYDKVRVAFQNTVADGTTECHALIVCATDGAITNGFIDNQIGKLNGIKINCLGDSLTYGYVPSSAGTSPMSPTWCSQLAADLQCTVRNYGITNNAVSNNSGGTGDPMCIRYTTMDDDADVVIVMGGTNDFLRVNAPLGTIDSMDNTTFYGAYNVLVQGLLSKYMTRKTRIILMVPPMRNRSTEQNTQGTTLQQIQQAVRDIAHKYALPFVDWAYDAGISAYLIGTDSNFVYTYDGIHIQQEIVLGWILPLIESKVIEAIKR